VYVTLESIRTIVSKPLVHPSTLDHALSFETQPMSYVGERWSPALTVTFRNQRRCDCHLSVRCDCGSTQEGLSLSDGASNLQLACFKLSITDSLVRLAISRFRHKKGDPRGSPRSAGMCAWL